MRSNRLRQPNVRLESTGLRPATQPRTPLDDMDVSVGRCEVFSVEQNFIAWLVSTLLPVISGLTGVVIGAWLTMRREKYQRRHDFLSTQLRDFYAPMLGMRSEIRRRGEVRLAISRAADTAWRELCAEARETSDAPTALKSLTDTRGPAFRSIIDYNNLVLAEATIPAYREMVKLFRGSLWLAEPSTRQHFGTLVEFVDIWERWLSGSLPAEAIAKLNHGEDLLEPLYQDLEEQHSRLREAVSKGEA